MSRVSKVVKPSLKLLAVGVVLLAGVLLIRTARFRSTQVPVPAVSPIAVDVDRVAGHLGGAIRHETVSHHDAGDAEFARFLDLHAYLKETFPRAAGRLRWEPIGTASLLITWEGTDATLKPLLLAAHMDVVPAVVDESGPGAETKTGPAGEGAAAPAGEGWEGRAFSGYDDGTHVWGRGTLDDKVAVLGILEATEALLAEGFAPRRTVLLAFGRDEEIGGRDGALRIAEELLRRDVRPECVLDEGSTLLEGVVPGIGVPVAAVGIAEKGYVDVALTVEAEGGHSSMPPAHTAIGILGRAVAGLEDHPYGARLDGISWKTLEALGPELPFAPRLALANSWLFGPLIAEQLSASTSMNALIRTSAAVTIIRGGVRDNVLPRSAMAIVNFRLLPGDTSQGLLDHVTKAVADPRVRVGFADPKVYSRVFEASKVAPIDSAAYATLRTAIRQTFPDALVVPTLVIAGTDARHYERLTDNIYRFLPIRLGPDDLERIHGVDERIGRENYAEVIRFYVNLMKRFN